MGFATHIVKVDNVLTFEIIDNSQKWFVLTNLRIELIEIKGRVKILIWISKISYLNIKFI